MEPARDDSLLTTPPPYVWQPRVKFQNRVWVHFVLLLLTIVTTTIAGAGHYLSFVSDFGAARVQLSTTELFVRGFWYSGTILAILSCHEFGHYFACRYYDVDASLPFFIPAPLPADRHAGRVHPDS